MKNYIKVSIVVILTFLLCTNLFIASSSAQNPPQTLVGVTELISVTSYGTQGNYFSHLPSISADGHYVVFISDATNLVVGDTNESWDIFVHDRVIGETTRVSVASDGTEGNDTSGFWGLTTISGDGRYVAFDSLATNLVVGDTNGYSDVFVHDREIGETTRVSVASDGTQGDYSSVIPSISADGRYVVFYSPATNLVIGDTNGFSDAFVHDRETGETTRVSVASDGTQGNGFSSGPSVSADGRYVAFASNATNLVEGGTNGYENIFVHDRVTELTTLVSVASDGTQGDYSSVIPSISADGRYVAFFSWATNLVAGDTNGFEEIFVHDRVTGKTTRVSVASDGTQGNSISNSPSISADGRYVAFDSVSTNLVVGDTNGSWDIFVHDRVTVETTRVSVASDGTEGNDSSGLYMGTTISGDGRYVAFYSDASNLVLGDTNGYGDIFVHDRVTGDTTRVSVASDETQGDGDSRWPSISADGRYVAFDSYASNLVVGDTNGSWDIFVHDREGLVVGYSVSGHVTDSDGNPLPGVSVSAGYGYSAITDSQGDYSISGLPSGTFRIFPSLTDIFFAPSWRMVSVPPERVGINFTEGFPTYFPIVGR